MDFKSWMTAVKDEAKITGLAIPATHNSGTWGMNRLACCQDGDIYEQGCMGIREFGVLYHGDKKGRLSLAHGIISGAPLEDAFRCLKRLIDETEEFFIIDLRKYCDEKYGPITFRYYDYPEKINGMIEKYLEPGKYALTDFENIREVTMGDIRRTGKRYIICSQNYLGGSKAEINAPWNPQVFGQKAEKFAKSSLQWFDKTEPEGFFGYQTQLTPGLGTENGIFKWQRSLDEYLRPYFKGMMQSVADNPAYLEKVNIVSGDFMTRDLMKQKAILRLNLLKGLIKEECVDEYTAMITE